MYPCTYSQIKFTICIFVSPFAGMSPPCRKRIQIQSWGSNRERDADYNAWDPVVWYSQRGYNVSEMIKAPGEQIVFRRRD